MSSHEKLSARECNRSESTWLKRHCHPDTATPQQGVAGSETVAERRTLVAGGALIGVRQLDAAFIALESGSKLPHSTADGIGDPRRALFLPHLRNIESRASGWLVVRVPARWVGRDPRSRVLMLRTFDFAVKGAANK
jgi:hypothetical protein